MRRDKTVADGRDQKRGVRFTIYNIIGIILCVLLLPVFIVCTTLLISSLIHPDVPPSCFGYTPLMVESDSMVPLFDTDDVVLIENGADDFRYNVGDVICFRSGDVYITHRVVGVSEQDGTVVYTTQGDANNTPDQQAVNQSQVLGVYITSVNGLGKVLMFIQTPVGMITCVMLPILVIFILFTVPPWVEERRRMKKLLAEKEAQNALQGETLDDGQN